MGMTLWIHVLEGREYSKDSDDHTLMYRHAESLDALCEEAGVRKFSEFFDFTDLEYSYAEEDDDSGAEPPVDPETGLGYGIEDMTWFEATEGRSSMQVLRERIAAGSVPELNDPRQSRGLIRRTPQRGCGCLGPLKAASAASSVRGALLRSPGSECTQ